MSHDRIEGKASLGFLLLFVIYFLAVGYYEFKDIGAFGKPLMLASTILGLYEYGTYTEKKIGSVRFMLVSIIVYIIQFFAFLKFQNKHFYTPYGVLFFIMSACLILKFFSFLAEPVVVEKLFKFADLCVCSVFCFLFFYSNLLSANLNRDSMMIRCLGIIVGIFVASVHTITFGTGTYREPSVARRR